MQYFLCSKWSVKWNSSLLCDIPPYAIPPYAISTVLLVVDMNYFLFLWNGIVSPAFLGPNKIIQGLLFRRKAKEAKIYSKAVVEWRIFLISTFHC